MKDFPHISQWNGFSPVCILLCIVKQYLPIIVGDMAFIALDTEVRKHDCGVVPAG